jgi:capsular exopolysaccharide synthesis family protein
MRFAGGAHTGCLQPRIRNARGTTGSPAIRCLVRALHVGVRTVLVREPPISLGHPCIASGHVSEGTERAPPQNITWREVMAPLVSSCPQGGSFRAMNESAETGTLRDYLDVLRQRRLLILLTTLLAVGASVAYSLTKEPSYNATATISFQDPTRQAGALIGQPQPDLFPQGDAAAGAEIVTSARVLNAVSQQPGVNLTPDQLRGMVSATVQTDSNLVSIQATNKDAGQAAKLANSFAAQTRLATRQDARKFFEKAANSLEDKPVNRPVRVRLKTLAAVADPVQVFRPAAVPGSPTTPKPLRDGIIAGLLGLLIGIGAAFLRHSLDRRLGDSHQVQREVGLPLVGYVRDEALGVVGWSRNGSGVTEEELEAFRILRTNVDFLAKDEQLRSVAVTSALPQEGKSTVATWYAYVNAVAGRRTALIECDFRRPVLAQRFDLPRSPGLSDYLAGDSEAKDVLRSVAVDGPRAVDVLPVIPAGENRFQPAEMIGSARFREFLEQVKEAYDLVVLDSAPLLPVGDTLELLPQVEGVLLCVRLNQTTREQAIAARAALEHLPPRPTGLVVTGMKSGSEDDYYGYYSYTASGSPDTVAG